jgi:hypothetical protein
MTCPWEALARAPAEFCEESLCGWIRQPGNTWSNIGFLLAGGAILYRAHREDAEHLRGLGYVALATGIGSAFFHASETLIGRFADWAGMYLGASYMLAVNVRRLSGWPPKTIRLVFWGNFLLGLALMVPAFRHPSVYYILETTFCCVLLEAILFVKQGKTVRYAWLIRYWLVFFVAYGLWMLDIKKILCDPGNHWISGHAVWHFLDAVALYFLFEYYRQFQQLRFEENGRPLFPVALR